MNTHYRHSQIGWVSIILCTILITIVVFREIIFSEPIAEIGRIVAFLIAVFSVIMLLMYRLEVSVADEKIKVRFGIAPVFPSFDLKDIKDAQAVKNPWWTGWGIRFAFHYWLYNVSGYDAVELTKTNGTRVRIGTDEPEQLAQAIRTQIAKN